MNDTTPKTSLLVGIVFGCLLLSVLMFVGFKRLDAIRRRREYRLVFGYKVGEYRVEATGS